MLLNVLRRTCRELKRRLLRQGGRERIRFIGGSDGARVRPSDLDLNQPFQVAIAVNESRDDQKWHAALRCDGSNGVATGNVTVRRYERPNHLDQSEKRDDFDVRRLGDLLDQRVSQSK